MDTVNPLLYGLSMAAGLAMGVSIADSQPVATLIQKFLPPIQRNSQNHAHPTPNIPTEDPMTALGSSNKPQNIQSSNFPNMTPKVSDDQMTQKLVARSKDGQDHYHHVVHYHIPYPMSVNAFNTAKSLYPNTPWYLSGKKSLKCNLVLSDIILCHPSDTTNSGGKPVVVSAYLSPSYRAPDAATSFFDPLMSQLTEDTRRSDTLLSGSSIIETPSATSVAALSSFPTDHYFRDVPKKLKKSSSSGAKSNKNSHSYYGLPSYHPSSSKDYHHSHHHHHHHSSKKDRISASLDDDQTFSGRAFGITSDTHPILPSLVSLQNKPSLASSASSPPPVISSSSHHGSSDKQNSLFSSSSSSPPTLNGTVNSSSYDHHYTNRSQNVNHGVTSDDAVASSSDSDDNDPGMDNLPLESNHHPQHKSSSSVSSAFPSVTTTYFTSTKR